MKVPSLFEKFCQGDEERPYCILELAFYNQRITKSFFFVTKISVIDFFRICSVGFCFRLIKGLMECISNFIDRTRCLFKVNNRSTTKRCQICLKLTIKTPERCYWRRSDVFSANFEHISHLFLVFLLLSLNK